MKLSVRHAFACTPDEFWEMFRDPAYDARLAAGTSVRRELVFEMEEGGVRVERSRFTPEHRLPGPVARLVGADRLVYEQENRFDPSTSSFSWRVVPGVLSDKVVAEGTFVVRPAAGGCERCVDGAIEVRVPVVGGRIEQQVVDAIRRANDAAAAATRAWLAERRHAP